MSGKSVLCLSFWYPNKSNKSFGIFVKRHVHAIATSANVKVLSYNVVLGDRWFSKSTQIFHDEKNIETHQIIIETRLRKLIYVALPLHYIILKNYIKHVFSENNFDALHSHVVFPCGIIGHYLAKKHKLKHIITEHWTKVDKFFTRSVYAHLGKKAYNNASAVTCVSQQLRNTLLKYHVRAPIHIVPNVIDASEFFFDPKIPKYDTFTFIGVANWAQHKNPFYFLDALQQLFLEQKLTSFQVVIAGNGEKLHLVKEKKYSFPIFYRGTLDGKQLVNEYNKSHIFVHGSEYETFSVVIAEALICGLPCVVSPVGIAPEVIDNSNGFITNNTLNDWKVKLLLAAKQQYDSADISARIKERYSMSAVGKSFAVLY